MAEIEVGTKGETNTTVTPDLLATHLGSGDLDVYGTPAMIALMEAAAVAAVDPLLPAGQSSVGVELNVRHLAGSPPGQKVRARATVTAVSERRITLSLQAWDEHELIGEGTHIRYVIDVIRFLDGVQKK